MELDAEKGEAMDILCFFSDLCREGRLESALTVLSHLVQVGRRDVLGR